MWRLIKNTVWGHPFYLIFFVTSKCNARCKMCFNWKNIDEANTRKELSIDEIEKITLSISNLQQLTMSGGEPFLRKELPEICKLFTKNSKVPWITISTNGLLSDLIEKNLSIILRENPYTQFRFSISMSGLDKASSEILQVKDSFIAQQETLAVAKAFLKKYSNLSVDVGIVYSKFNEDEIRNILDYINEYYPFANPMLAVVRGDTRETSAKEIDLIKLNEAFEYQKHFTKKAKNHPYSRLINPVQDLVHDLVLDAIAGKRAPVKCLAGKTLMVLSDDGELSPCEMLRKPFGNLRDCNYDIKELLALKRTKEILATIKDTRCFCSWECALYNNIIFSNQYRLKVLLKAM
jgi:MoaA/NifB/PqqE/SkfB family radical SAM enzyme